MNPEKLHDALNLLEDDLILEVERLRRPRTFRWRHLGALAACLTVVCVVGVFGYGLARDAGSAESTQGGTVPEMAIEDGLTEQEDIQSGRKETKPQTTVPGVDMVDSDYHVVIMETVLLEVTKIEQDRFTATVLVSDRNYAQGDTVTVLLTELTWIVRGCKVESAWPLDDFSVGAALVVDYSSGPEKNTITAERISFGE